MAKMTFDSLLKNLGIRRRSLAERVNNRVLSGYGPSQMARAVVGRVSASKINSMWKVTLDRFSEMNKET